MAEQTGSNNRNPGQPEPAGAAPTAPQPTILRSAALMAFGTFVSRVLGMIRDMVMAAHFSTMVTDAYVVAFRLPNLFRRVLGEGSLSASFVPLYVEADQRDEAEARQFANAVFSMLSALTSTLTVLGIIFMRPIITSWVSGEGYALIPGKLDLTIWLAQITFIYLFIVMTYAYLMAIANAHHAFFWAGMAPAVFNAGMIVFTFMPSWRVDGDQLAIGVVVGGVFQLLMTLWPLWKLKKIPRLTSVWMSAATKKFFKTLLPSIIGMSVGQLLGILNVSFTSELGQGSHSYIYYADRLLELPQALMSVSLGMALLPTLSALWARGEQSKFLQTVQHHIQLLMVLMLPAAVGLYVLAEPIVRVLFGRGRFDEHAIAETAIITKIYAVVLVFSGLHRVTVPAFYAIKNTWLPAVNAIVCLCVHYFVARWAVHAYGLSGLVCATTFTGGLNLALLLIQFRLTFGSLGVWPFMKSALWLAPALLVMGYASPLIYHIGHAQIGALGSLIITLPVAGALYFGVALLSRQPNVGEVMAIVKRKLKR